MLLLKLAPHFPACARMVLPSERFSLAFELDSVVKGMRLPILAFCFIFNPAHNLKSKKRLQTETKSDGLLDPDIPGPA